MDLSLRVLIPARIAYLLFSKTVFIGGPLLGIILLLALPLQIPDLLTDADQHKLVLIGACLLYSMTQVWYWTRQMIFWQFAFPSRNTYLAFDVCIRQFFIARREFVTKGTYVRPIVITNKDRNSIVLFPSRTLLILPLVYTLLIPYAYFEMVSTSIAASSLKFAFGVFNLLAVLWLTYAAYTVISEWYWDVREVEREEFQGVYEARRRIPSSALDQSLLRFLFCRWSTPLFLVLSALPLGLVVFSALHPGSLAGWFGAEGILFLALGSIVATGCLAALVLIAVGLPPLLTVLSWLTAVSIAAPLVHKVPAVSLEQSSSVRQNGLTQEFCLWLQANGVSTSWAAKTNSCTLIGQIPDRKLPIIFVSASGGGLRASYWTASVLGVLSDCIPGFDAAAFSISAVSGGSLGAVVYDVGRSLSEPSQRSCDLKDHFTTDTHGAPVGFSIRKFAEDTLTRDFLGPILERMFFGDLFSSFFPIQLFANGLKDRGDILRESWGQAILSSCEQSGFECGSRDRFAVPLLKWRTGASWAPVTVFNATHLETGARIVMSTSAFDSEALDFHELTGADITLGNAVLNSARFPLISPAGAIQHADGEGKTYARGHVIDGGFFDNTGARTTYELAREVLAVAEGLKVTLVPIFLNLENDPTFWDVMRMSKSVAESYFNGRGLVTQADAFKVLSKERATNPEILVGPERSSEQRFEIPLTGAGIFHELLAGVRGIVTSWQSLSAASHSELDALYRGGAKEVNVRLCASQEHNPTLAWKLGPQSRAVIEGIILQKPVVKATPEAINVLFLSTLMPTDTEIEEMFRRGEKDEAMEWRSRKIFFDVEASKLNAQYFKLFDKNVYGEGFGRQDVLGSALALNLCHNALHESIQLLANELRSH